MASRASLFDEPVLAHLCRMAALEASETPVRFPSPWGPIIGIWDWDVANDRSHLDPECAKLFGVNVAKASAGLPNETYLKAIHPDDVPSVAGKLDLAIKRGGVFEAQYRVVNDGRVRQIFAKGYCTLDRSRRPERLPGAIMEL